MKTTSILKLPMIAVAVLIAAPLLPAAEKVFTSGSAAPFLIGTFLILLIEIALSELIIHWNIKNLNAGCREPTAEAKRVFIPSSILVSAPVLGMIGYAGYHFASLTAVQIIGRPSSLAHAGFVFLPFYLIPVAGISLLTGLVPAGLSILIGHLRKTPDGATAKATTFHRCLSIAIIATALVAPSAGWLSIVRYEKFNAPQLLSNAGNFIKSTHPTAGKSMGIASFPMTWSRLEKRNEPFNWNSHEFTIDVSSTLITLSSDSGESVASYDTRNRTSPSGVAALPIRFQPADAEHLCVLVQLRPSSRRSILLIYDPDQELVYEELLERQRRREGQQYLAHLPDHGNEALFIDISTPFTIETDQSNEKNMGGTK